MSQLQVVNQTPSLKQIIDLFCYKYDSKHTQTAYRKEIVDFIDFLNQRSILLDSIRPFHLEVYLNESGKETASSRNRSISAIKAFTRWLEANEAIPRDTLRSFSLTRVSVEKPTIAFTDSEVKAILDSVDESTLAGNCDSLILYLLFFLGMRRSEIVNLKLSNVISDRGHTVIRFSGKGSKHRSIPIAPVLQEKLQEYVQKYEQLSGHKIGLNEYLLQRGRTISKKPINVSTVLRAVKKYAKIAGVNKRVSPHSCRATAISQLLEKNVSIRNVADFAGHSSTTTTQLYDKKRDGYENSAAYEVAY